MRLVRPAAAVLAALVAAGCAFNASPADGLRFHAPAGWSSSPGIMGLMQFWHPAADDRQVLMLFKSPKPLKPGDVFSDARMNDTLKDVIVERRSPIAICQGQPATYVEARGRSARGDDERVEIVMTNAGGSSYFAMYVRPLVGAPNPMAQAALRELCLKS
ncbi:MAG: hypothetical protein JO104_01015 [Candidatus Eremiobacteraeota bacterium]|nr:hypothetical protein [Candidatus Eremiobacteraeota bacterium]